MPFDFGLRTGVKHGTRPIAWAKATVSCAVKQLPLSASHSTGCGVCEGAEAALDREQHEVAHRDAADPARAGGPGEDLAVVGVDGEGDPDGVAVPARDLEHVRGPAPVRDGGRDLAVVRALTAAAGVRRQQQARPLHHAVDPLMVGPGQTLRLGLAVQERGDPPVAVARPGVDQGPDAGEQLGVAGLAIWRSRPAPASLRPLREVRARNPSVSATAFIGNRPDRATASATAVFLPARRRAPP